MNKTDLFTLLRLGHIADGEIVFRYKDNYVVAKMTELQYHVQAGNLTTFTVSGIIHETP